MQGHILHSRSVHPFLGDRNIHLLRIGIGDMEALFLGFVVIRNLAFLNVVIVGVAFRIGRVQERIDILAVRILSHDGIGVRAVAVAAHLLLDGSRGGRAHLLVVLGLFFLIGDLLVCRVVDLVAGLRIDPVSGGRSILGRDLLHPDDREVTTGIVFAEGLLLRTFFGEDALELQAEAVGGFRDVVVSVQFNRAVYMFTGRTAHPGLGAFNRGLHHGVVSIDRDEFSGAAIIVADGDIKLAAAVVFHQNLHGVGIRGVLDDIAVFILGNIVSLAVLGHCYRAVRNYFLDLVDELAFFFSVCRNGQVAQLDNKAVEVGCVFIHGYGIRVFIRRGCVIRKRWHHLDFGVGRVRGNLVIVGGVFGGSAQFGLDGIHLEGEGLVLPDLADVLFHHANLGRALGLRPPVGHIELVDDGEVSSSGIAIPGGRILRREGVGAFGKLLVLVRIGIAVASRIRLRTVPGDDMVDGIFLDGVVDPLVVHILVIARLIRCVLNVCIGRQAGPGDC